MKQAKDCATSLALERLKDASHGNGMKRIDLPGEILLIMLLKHSEGMSALGILVCMNWHIHGVAIELNIFTLNERLGQTFCMPSVCNPRWACHSAHSEVPQSHHNQPCSDAILHAEWYLMSAVVPLVLALLLLDVVF